MQRTLSSETMAIRVSLSAMVIFTWGSPVERSDTGLPVREEGTKRVKGVNTTILVLLLNSLGSGWLFR